jgi:hypothetical protein
MGFDREWKTAPVVAGAVYRKLVVSGGVVGATLHAIMGPTRAKGNLPKEGLLHVYGHAPERVQEGKESMSGWDLVAIPHELDEPIRSEERLDEKERLEKELALTRYELAQVRGTVEL